MPVLRSSPVTVDPSQIPDCRIFAMLSTIYKEAGEYIQQPGVAEKFGRWKAAKEKKTAEAAKKTERKE